MTQGEVVGRAGEIRVEVRACGLCHSDEHVRTGAMPMPHCPLICGHEGAGVVTEVGPGVTSVQPGDHVAMSFVPSCGACTLRRTGRAFLHRGCPIAATGIANVWEIATQLRGEAGDRQIDNAKVGPAHVIGLGSACGVPIVEKAAV